MPPTIEHLKRLNGRFLAVPREYTYFCREHRGKPTVPARILRIYVYESKQNDEYLSLSEGDLGERMDWEWSERTIAEARRFLVRRGLLLSDSTIRTGCRSRLVVNRELLERERQGLPVNWERELLDYLRQKNRRAPRKAGQPYLGPVAEAGQNCAESGAELRRLPEESGAKVAQNGAVSLFTKNLVTEEERKELARVPEQKSISFRSAPKTPDPAEAEMVRYVESEFAGWVGRSGAGMNQQTVITVARGLLAIPEGPQRQSTWDEIAHKRPTAMSAGLFVDILQRAAQNRVAAPKRSIAGYRDMFAAEEEALGRKSVGSEGSHRAEAARHG
jgi:hypothetical protein